MTAKEVILIINTRNIENGHGKGYDNYISVKATTIQDSDARISANKQVSSYYSIWPSLYSRGCNTGSCLDVAHDALRATKIDFLQILPNEWFKNFGWYNNGGGYSKSPIPKKVTLEVGEITYRVVD